MLQRRNESSQAAAEGSEEGDKPSFSQTEKSIQGSMKWRCKDFK